MVVEAYTNGLSFEIWSEIDVQISGSRCEVFNYVNYTACHVVYPKVVLSYRAEQLPWLRVK